MDSQRNLTKQRPSPFVVDLNQAAKRRRPHLDLARQSADKSELAGGAVGFVFKKISASWRFVRQPGQRLAIIALLRFFYRLLAPGFRLFFNIAYGLGWLAVFSLRFVWLLAQKAKGLFFAVPIWSPKKITQPQPPGPFFSRQRQQPAAAPAEQIIQPPTAWHQPVKNFFSRFLRRLWLVIKSAAWLPVRASQLLLAYKLLLAYLGQLAAKAGRVFAGGNFYFWPSRPNRPAVFWRAARQAISFGLVGLILVLPFKAYTYYQTVGLPLRGAVLGASEKAVKNIIAAGRQAANLSLGQAQSSFLAAGQDFAQAQILLNNINGILFKLAALAPDPNLRLAGQGKVFLTIGEKASLLGSELSAAGDCLAALFAGRTASATSAPASLKQAVNHLQQASLLAGETEALLAKVPAGALPAKYQPDFVSIKSQARQLSSVLASLADLSQWAYRVLGGEQDKRYLLVFQNNAEARATGGFIGSYALVDVSAGRIKHFEAPAGGSYDTAGGLTEFIAAPQPLQLIQARWFFWDANWWPDWPTSARQLAWFLEKSDGPTVDGVISLTPTVLERLLAVIGPIKLGPPYNVVIDKDNFWPQVQAFAEQKPPQTKRPKQIIGDLMSEILSRLARQPLSRETIVKLGKVWQSCLSEKHILIYLADQDLEAKAKSYGWGGEILPADQDYLMVVNTNIGGGKSDRGIIQTIEHQTEIQADGQIIDTIKITRRHQGIDNPFVKVRNIDWLRVYVPLGSKLLAADGFAPPTQPFEQPDPDWQVDARLQAEESSAQLHLPSGTKIYTESGKTVFANWSQVAPGQIATIRLKYILPFRFSAAQAQADRAWPKKIINLFFGPGPRFYPYSLLVQKQPGSQQTVLIKKITISKFFALAFSHPLLNIQNYQAGRQTFNFRQALKSDSFFSFLFYPHF